MISSIPTEFAAISLEPTAFPAISVAVTEFALSPEIEAVVTPVTRPSAPTVTTGMALDDP